MSEERAVIVTKSIIEKHRDTIERVKAKYEAARSEFLEAEQEYRKLNRDIEREIERALAEAKANEHQNEAHQETSL